MVYLTALPDSSKGETAKPATD